MRGARFRRGSRLVKTEDYKNVFAQATRWRIGKLTVLAHCNQLGYPRLGLAIAKKHVPTAVARNRIKRIVRENFRLQQHELGGIDIVVLAQSGAADQSRSDLHATMAAHCRKLRSLCKSS